ncbi:MAG: hypothetical protein A2X25_10505 [Chloroflexi bacterium GWB2_49_20]|nr:MAG: hypothetical protein A2X25_10505 [Chloroflexi bacterium GWB2_49_20]OGN79005.1 MAG: hypothetical protein A2X26_00850 [Chloroflexi bacterium GWC2_49_37]OGN86234.1 MAG: hypothetical protein A2X27_04930 [Chloroflexi bacterium GWD2_49_16]
MVIIGFLGFFNFGRYANSKGGLYVNMHGKSGTVMTLENITRKFGRVNLLIIGIAADRFELTTAMWVFIADPVALLVGLLIRKNKIT